MDNQLIQWLPLFGFGSVLTILIAIIGVGVGLWRNAESGHAAIGRKIDDLRMEIRGFRSEMRMEIRGVRSAMSADSQGVRGELSDLRKDVSGLQVEMGKVATDLGWIKNRMGGPIGSERR